MRSQVQRMYAQKYNTYVHILRDNIFHKQNRQLFQMPSNHVRLAAALTKLKSKWIQVQNSCQCMTDQFSRLL